MRIERFTAYVVRLQLRRPFDHASHRRIASDNVVVCCRLADGVEGWGEGVPREYVTGETPDGALEQLAATDLCSQFDCDCFDWKGVLGLCAAYRPSCAGEDPRRCRTNAHRCAIELSVLDAFGRLFREPISRAIAAFEAARPIRQPSGYVRYSGAVSLSTPRREAVTAVKMRLFGFRHCKVKVGASLDENRARLRRARRWLGRRMDVRVDANEAWRPEEVARQIEPLTENGVGCVEQPVAHREVEALRDIRREISLPVMLDESLASVVDAENAIQGKTADLFNIRLSKCGGLLDSLRIAALAHGAGLGYQLGCHPGESGILSAAGRHFATSVRGVRYAEGSYERHLLRELLTHEDITFGYGGHALPLTAPGLGVTVNRDVLQRITLKKQEYRVR